MEQYIESLSIAPPDELATARARERWNAIAKPVGSLGALEDAVVQIAALTGDSSVSIKRRCVAVLCADNGVVAQNVSQSGADVTLAIAHNVARGVSSVNKLCEPMGIDCVAVDMGMFERVDEPGILDRRIASGTGDISLGPAMTRAQALTAVRSGVELVGELVAKGYRLIATGEMGIGNTTTSTAMACAFLGMDPLELAGPGAGLPAEGVRHKAEVIRRALEVNEPSADDPLDVLAKLGGFDIAGMCGLFLGGALYRVPVVIDGFISTVAALCALRLRPDCRHALLASHLSAEPAAGLLFERMGLDPILRAGMRLGEGTGAVCMIPVLDMALNLYTKGLTFEECAITSYKVDE